MEELERAVISPDSHAGSFSWDALCDLLDDRPSISTDSRSFTRDSASFFFSTHSGRHTLEVFWLKLCLLESFCRKVAAVHRTMERPLLRLDSQHVHVAFPSGDNGYLPTLWRGTIILPNLLDTPSGSVEGMPAEMDRMVSATPSDIDATYISPQIREWPAGREIHGTALIESVDDIPGDDEHGAQGLIRIHFIADTIAAEAFSSRDVFDLTIPFSSGTIRLWARKVDSPERGIVLSGVTAMLSTQALKSLQGQCHQVISRTVARIYRAHSTESDAYSLGMLWFRAILGSDRTRWDHVVRLLPGLLNSLPPAVQGIDASDVHTMHTRVKEFLQEEDKSFANADIPSDLWWDGILMGLRALSRIPGFSYEYMSIQHESSSNVISAELLLLDAEQLGKRAKVELFESDERDAAIAGACNAALHQLGMA